MTAILSVFGLYSNRQSMMSNVHSDLSVVELFRQQAEGFCCSLNAT